jgi:hypothetical protein
MVKAAGKTKHGPVPIPTNLFQHTVRHGIRFQRKRRTMQELLDSLMASIRRPRNHSDIHHSVTSPASLWRSLRDSHPAVPAIFAARTPARMQGSDYGSVNIPHSATVFQKYMLGPSLPIHLDTDRHLPRIPALQEEFIHGRLRDAKSTFLQIAQNHVEQLAVPGVRNSGWTGLADERRVFTHRLPGLG